MMNTETIAQFDTLYSETLVDIVGGKHMTMLNGGGGYPNGIWSGLESAVGLLADERRRNFRR